MLLKGSTARCTRFAIYRLYNGHGALLYIGISEQHHIARPIGHLGQDWGREICHIDIRDCDDDEATARAKEKAAIQAERPKYNITHNKPPKQRNKPKKQTSIVELPKRSILKSSFIRGLKPAPRGQRYCVSDVLVPGLRVRVSDKGTKSFILWRRLDVRAKSASALTLGRVGLLTLEQARAKAREWLALISQGHDPRCLRARQIIKFSRRLPPRQLELNLPPEAP